MDDGEEGGREALVAKRGKAGAPRLQDGWPEEEGDSSQAAMRVEVHAPMLIVSVWMARLTWIW